MRRPSALGPTLWLGSVAYSLLISNPLMLYAAYRLDRDGHFRTGELEAWVGLAVGVVVALVGAALEGAEEKHVAALKRLWAVQGEVQVLEMCLKLLVPGRPALGRLVSTLLFSNKASGAQPPLYGHPTRTLRAEVAQQVACSAHGSLRLFLGWAV